MLLLGCCTRVEIHDDQTEWVVRVKQKHIKNRREEKSV